MAAADESDRPGPGDDDRARSGDDRDAIDRAFADLIAGYHLTAERPSPAVESAERSEPAAEPVAEPVAAEPPSSGWADNHPLFRYEPEPAAETEPKPEERFVPPPPEPLPKPAWPVLVAWIAMGYAMLLLLAVVVGVRFPAWAGWLAIIGFVGGFGILVTRLPRERPPDAGDGAVL